MTARTVRVERLRVKLPRSSVGSGRTDADALARSIAGSLASKLQDAGKGQPSGTVARVRAEVPRGRPDASAIAIAIHAAIVRARGQP